MHKLSRDVKAGPWFTAVTGPGSLTWNLALPELI